MQPTLHQDGDMDSRVDKYLCLPRMAAPTLEPALVLPPPGRPVLTVPTMNTTAARGTAPKAPEQQSVDARLVGRGKRWGDDQSSIQWSHCKETVPENGEDAGARRGLEACAQGSGARGCLAGETAGDDSSRIGGVTKTTQSNQACTKGPHGRASSQGLAAAEPQPKPQPKLCS